MNRVSLPEKALADLSAQLGNVTMHSTIMGAEVQLAREALEASYALLAECVRADHVPNTQTIFAANPDFHAWYMKKYNNSNYEIT